MFVLNVSGSASGPSLDLVTVQGYKGILFQTLIASSKQQKVCNPPAITTILIDSTDAERDRQRDQETRQRERER